MQMNSTTGYRNIQQLSNFATNIFLKRQDLLPRAFSIVSKNMVNIDLKKSY